MKDRKKPNNKGFTLVELLICLAISAFVILATYSFVMVGTQSYENNSKNATIQEEAGFVINSVGEAIITGKWNKSDINTNPSTNDITITLGDQPNDKIIFYDVSEKKLLIYKKSEITPSFSIGSDPDNHLLSSYVDSFSADYVQTSETAAPKTRLINIKLRIVKKDRTASSEHVFEMRNKE